MNIKGVLFATDFSPASGQAGQMARDMARKWGATLHVIHVVPPVTDPADAPAKLERLKAAFGDGVKVETELRTGRVARHIIEYAREHDIGLIVVGTHGRTGVSRALLGSVAETVVRLAPCPVLTVTAETMVASSPVVAPEAPPAHRCVVCARETEELICEACRARIRGEALEHKIEEERPGRRGLPV
ncbi:MAG TPA: universal stress protein [Methylomirabilota bacterium]|nr:universal stress protein [Methylomirabilota bacterium]